MNEKKYFVWRILFLASMMLWCCPITCKSEFTKLGDDIKNKAKSAWHGAKAMGKGFAQGFGIPLPEYKYSYIVFNDAPTQVVVAEFQIVNFMGARFAGSVDKHTVLVPMTNTGRAFYNRQLYFAVFICTTDDPNQIYKYAHARKDWAKKGIEAFPVPLSAAIGAFAGSEKTLTVLRKYKILEDVVYPWKPHDHNIYFYRAYADKNKLKGEFLDIKSLTDKFSGQFYNSSKIDVMLQFTKDDETFKVLLEKDSFNLLSSSDKPHSIRPPKGSERAFTFFGDLRGHDFDKQFAYIPIPSEGIAYIADSKADSKALEKTPKGELPKPGVPMLYTYEVFEYEKELQVGLQGLAIGHHHQPLTGRIRDINPVICQVWFKSADQVIQAQQKALGGVQKEQDYSSRPIDFLEEVLISYKSDDFSYQKKLVPGQVDSFTLIRPRLRETKANLFIISLPPGLAEQTITGLLIKLYEGDIGEKALYTEVSNPLDAQDIAKSLGTNLHGIVVDEKWNIQFAIKLADTFYPQGVGQGPFYYIVEPDILRIDQFANSIYFDNSWYTKNPTTGALVLKPEVYKELYEKLPVWIKLYRSDKSKAADELKNYLKIHVNAQLFKKGTKEFNDQGERHFEQLLEGPISLKNYPLLRKTGVNYYAYGLGRQPDDWPGAKVDAKGA